MPILPGAGHLAEDEWELHNGEEDWSQANDLADKYPEKLKEPPAVPGERDEDEATTTRPRK